MRKLNMWTNWKWMVGALALALAAPATGGTLYRYLNDEGSVAFTDDLERVPQRHRADAKRLEIEGFEGYERYTPSQVPAAKAAPRLAAPVMLAADATLAAQPAPSAGGSEAIVQVNDSTALRIPTAEAGSDEPLIVEEVRVLRDGSNFTIHDTVVRRGDKVIMVVRPAQSHQAGPGDWVDEDELLSGD